MNIAQRPLARIVAGLTLGAFALGTLAPLAQAQTALKQIGKAEGQVDIVAWPGYIERGQTDKNFDWVTDFEKKTGCKVNVKTAGTSDEMVALMNEGGFDLVTASGDASMRLIAGKTLMDRNAPEGLTDTVESSRADMEALIAAWHGKGRLGYAARRASPSAAATNSWPWPARCWPPIRASGCRPICRKTPTRSRRRRGCSRRPRTISTSMDRFGLLRERSVFAHCVHLHGDAFQRMAAKGGAAAFCPTSNLFLGSGLFPLKEACAHGVKVGMGTDVGAGTTFSILHTLGEAYKVGQLRGDALDPFHAFYLGTLGGARALDLDDKIGNLAPGKEADFLALDLAATPLIARRLKSAKTLEDKLFALTVLGDDRVVARTYLAGVEWYRRGV